MSPDSIAIVKIENFASLVHCSLKLIREIFMGLGDRELHKFAC
jgi:hypothetical protein